MIAANENGASAQFTERPHHIGESIDARLQKWFLLTPRQFHRLPAAMRVGVFKVLQQVRHGGIVPSSEQIDGIDSPPLSLLEMLPKPSAEKIFTHNEYRKRLQEVYREHEPANVDRIDYLLSKYRGHEHFLYVFVCTRNDIDPKLFVKAPPTPWVPSQSRASIAQSSEMTVDEMLHAMSEESERSHVGTMIRIRYLKLASAMDLRLLQALRQYLTHNFVDVRLHAMLSLRALIHTDREAVSILRTLDRTRMLNSCSTTMLDLKLCSAASEALGKCQSFGFGGQAGHEASKAAVSLMEAFMRNKEAQQLQKQAQQAHAASSENILRDIPGAGEAVLDEIATAETLLDEVGETQEVIEDDFLVEEAADVQVNAFDELEEADALEGKVSAEQQSKPSEMYRKLHTMIYRKLMMPSAPKPVASKAASAIEKLVDGDDDCVMVNIDDGAPSKHPRIISAGMLRHGGAPDGENYKIPKTARTPPGILEQLAKCKHGHPMKRFKNGGRYSCDECGSAHATYIFRCSADCDFDLCIKCCFKRCFRHATPVSIGKAGCPKANPRNAGITRTTVFNQPNVPPWRSRSKIADLLSRDGGEMTARHKVPTNPDSAQSAAANFALHQSPLETNITEQQVLRLLRSSLLRKTTDKLASQSFAQPQVTLSSGGTQQQSLQQPQQPWQPQEQQHRSPSPAKQAARATPTVSLAPSEGIRCDDTFCGKENPANSKFCCECGRRLNQPANRRTDVIQETDPSSLHEVQSRPESQAKSEIEFQHAVSIMGFKISENLQIRNSDSEWQMMQELIKSRHDVAVKQEIEVVDIADVFFLQEKCSDCFRCGRPLSDLRDGLKNGIYNSMSDEFLVLDVIRANLKDYLRRGLPRKPVMYTLDHRRLKCMKDAGISRVRVRVVLDDKYLDQFVSKGIENIGLRSDVRIKKRRRF